MVSPKPPSDSKSQPKTELAEFFDQVFTDPRPAKANFSSPGRGSEYLYLIPLRVVFELVEIEKVFHTQPDRALFAQTYSETHQKLHVVPAFDRDQGLSLLSPQVAGRVPVEARPWAKSWAPSPDNDLTTCSFWAV